MDIKEYFDRLNANSQSIFQQTTLDKSKLGELHHFSSCIYELSAFVVDHQERSIIETVCAQLESATFNVTLGLYRQAFASLRLALELGLAAIYFSVNKLELQEWLDGEADIKWSILVDENNGVLSKRFSKAFFSDLTTHVSEYRIKATNVYRSLSEYVHGNSETWEKSGLKLSFNSDLLEKYLNDYKEVAQVVLFVAVCRYALFFDASDRDSLQSISEEFSHITEITKLFGHR